MIKFDFCALIWCQKYSLGRCKGEQSCATRCFAEFGSEDLNSWLSCTIEENECVKVPKNVDNVSSFENTQIIRKIWFLVNFVICFHCY
jgi:hypothetical protein